jgi:hypothetical protein
VLGKASVSALPEERPLDPCEASLIKGPYKTFRLVKPFEMGEMIQEISRQINLQG